MTPAEPLPPLEPYGRALADFFAGDREATIRLRSSLNEDDPLPAEVFFRDADSLFPFEEYALELCRGRVLDVGAGTGVHALILQERGFDVTAVEVVPQAVEILRRRGVRDIVAGDAFALEGGGYDTLLMLMNGIGPVGTLARIEGFLGWATRMLAPGGQILVDSAAPVVHETPVAPAAGAWPPATPDGYPGEACIELEYRGERGAPFRELYLDPGTLAERADRAGWSCTIGFEHSDIAYVARLAR